jgi:hypothetical protein
MISVAITGCEKSKITLDDANPTTLEQSESHEKQHDAAPEAIANDQTPKLQAPNEVPGNSPSDSDNSVSNDADDRGKLAAEPIDNSQTAPPGNHLQKPLEAVEDATKTIYDAINALTPEFASCYNKAKNIAAQPINYESGRIDLEYDENGFIYYKETPELERRKHKVKPYINVLTECYLRIIPKSFDIHLEEVVKDYPDCVQRFGHLKFVYNPGLNKIEFSEKYSLPIGTVHTNKYDEKRYSYEWDDCTEYSKH